jgi:hypothetical protein
MSGIPRALPAAELYWVGVVLLCALLARLNVPPSERGNEWLLLGAQWLPVITLPPLFWLSFAVWPRGDASWAWVVGRLWLGTLVGLNLAAWLLAGTVDHGDTRNAGLGSLPPVVAAYGTLVFAACAAVSALTLTGWGWKGNVLAVAAGLVWLLALLVMIGAGARTLAWLWAAAPPIALALRWIAGR